MSRISYLILILLFINISVNAAVTVSPATSGNCLNITPASFLPIGDIVITEGSNGDFSIQSNKTLILSAPAGFMFQPGSGNVSFLASRNITAASISVTLTTITVTISVSGIPKADELIISNIYARASTSNVSGNILRKSPGGGTATISGNAAGAGINHGTLSCAGTGQTVTSVANGSWSNPATWQGGKIPLCTDNVIIYHQINVDVVTPALTSLIIKAGAKLIANLPVIVNSNFTIEANAWYVHNNNSNAATTIFNGTESIDDNATIEVNNWSAAAVPFMTGISSTVGNLILNYNAVWQQDGLFAPSKIKGNLSVTNGQVVMDDGTGMSTLLNLNHVSIYKTGAIIFAQGANRNLTLNTLSFTDSSKSNALTALMFRTYGTLEWKNAGSVYLSHDFSAVEGTAGYHAFGATVNIGGDLSVVKGKVDFFRYVDGNGVIQVSGNTYCNLTAGNWFRLADYNTVNLDFTTNNLSISGTESCYLQGSDGSTNFNINGSFSYTASSLFVFINNFTNSALQQINVSKDFFVTSGNVGLAFTSGKLNTHISGNLSVSGSSTQLVSQFYPYGTDSVIFVIDGNCSLSGGMFNVSWNRGPVNFISNGIFNQTNANFEVVFHPFPGNYAACSVFIDSLNFSGGTFKVFDSYITDGKTVSITTGSDVNINFQNSSDRFVLISNTLWWNNPALNLTINGDLKISGNNSAIFASNVGGGNESIVINGNFDILGGVNSIGGSTSLGSKQHDITVSINGSLTQTGGQFYYSINEGNVDYNILNDLIQTGGMQNLTYQDAAAKLQIGGKYLQSGGTFNFHGSTGNTSLADSVIVNGNFSQSNGVLRFDNAQGSLNMSQNVVVLNSDSVLFSGNGVITHANHLTTNTLFGKILYNKTGTSSFQRATSTHDLQQVEMVVGPLTTLDVKSSIQPLLIASHASSSPAVNNVFTINGVLDMGLQRIMARQQGNYYSQLSVGSTGKIKTMNPNGLYSISTASTINTLIAGNNRMNFWLDAQSTIEYNGNQNQNITGIPNGIANSSSNKYGKLQIDFAGVNNINFVKPEADSAVFVRSALVLTSGELNLNADHVSNTNGLSIVLENGCQIFRASGYIRSETIDGSAAVHLSPQQNAGYEIPFGYNSTAYIPFKYQCTNGCDWVSLATYRSLPDNTPFPPGVNHVRSISGADNSLQTIDRYWYVNAVGNPNANLKFTYAPIEKGSISTPRAQRWIGNDAWESFKGMQSNPTPYETEVNGITGLNSWWTLSSQSSPLPVEILSFNANCQSQRVVLNWSVATQRNNDIFILERSRDGKKWENLTSIKGAGTTNTLMNYETKDEAPYAEVTYYRLAQIDYDGKRNELKTIAVKGCGSDPVRMLYYSFTDHKIFIKIQSSYNDKIDIFLFNENGQTVARKVQNIDNNIQEIQMECPQLNSGIYMLSIRGSFNNIIKKLVKN